MERENDTRGIREEEFSIKSIRLESALLVEWPSTQAAFSLVEEGKKLFASRNIKIIGQGRMLFGV